MCGPCAGVRQAPGAMPVWPVSTCRVTRGDVQFAVVDYIPGSNHALKALAFELRAGDVGGARLLAEAMRTNTTITSLELGEARPRRRKRKPRLGLRSAHS